MYIKCFKRALLEEVFKYMLYYLKIFFTRFYKYHLCTTILGFRIIYLRTSIINFLNF